MRLEEQVLPKQNNTMHAELRAQESALLRRMRRRAENSPRTPIW